MFGSMGQYYIDHDMGRKIDEVTFKADWIGSQPDILGSLFPNDTRLGGVVKVCDARNAGADQPRRYHPAEDDVLPGRVMGIGYRVSGFGGSRARTVVPVLVNGCPFLHLLDFHGRDHYIAFGS